MDQIPEFVPRRSFLQQWEKMVYLFFAILFAFLFLSYAWPTQHRYEHHNGALVRIGRSTLEAEVLTDNGWREMKPQPATRTRANELMRKYGLDTLPNSRPTPDTTN